MDNPTVTFQMPLDHLLEQLTEKLISKMPTVTRAPLPEIIDTAELCKRLAISEPTVIKLRKKKFPHFKLGVLIRYNWPTVVEFLQKKSITP